MKHRYTHAQAEIIFDTSNRQRWYGGDINTTEHRFVQHRDGKCKQRAKSVRWLLGAALIPTTCSQSRQKCRKRKMQALENVTPPVSECKQCFHSVTPRVTLFNVQSEWKTWVLWCICHLLVVSTQFTPKFSPHIFLSPSRQSRLNLTFPAFRQLLLLRLLFHIIRQANTADGCLSITGCVQHSWQVAFLSCRFSQSFQTSNLHQSAPRWQLCHSLGIRPRRRPGHRSRTLPGTQDPAHDQQHTVSLRTIHSTTDSNCFYNTTQTHLGWWR